MDIIYVNKEEFINDNIRIVQTDKKDNIHFYSINYQYDDKLLSYLNILINSLPLCNKRYGAYQYSDKSAHLPLNTETDVYMSVMSFIQKIRDYVIDKIMINYTGDHVFDPEYISSLKTKKIKIEIMHKGKLCKIRKLVPKNDKYESIKTINDFNKLMKDYKYNNDSGSHYIGNLIISFRCYVYKRDDKLSISFTPYLKLVEMIFNKANIISQIDQCDKIAGLNNILVI
jgi:hypothetical protein